MTTIKKFMVLAAVAVIGFSSCKKDDDDNDYEIPTTYNFERNGMTSVSYLGQNERLDMLLEMKTYLKTGDSGSMLSATTLNDAYANTGDNGNGFFSFTSTKQLKNKTFQIDLDNSFIENLFLGAETASSNGNTASNGVAGLLTRENSGNTILVDENGKEFTQMVEKGIMGTVFYNQIYNTYLTDDKIGASVDNKTIESGKNYTALEHHWDEAFGYWNAPIDFTSNWDELREDEARYWSHYSDVVDEYLQTNDAIMKAFLAGRAAIVNDDRAEIITQKGILYNKLELVAAAAAIHYINSTLTELNNGNTGEAFHTLTEAWTFTNALRYSPNRQITLVEINTILNTDFGSNGNFWAVTTSGLNTAKSTLVQIYPELEVHKDLL